MAEFERQSVFREASKQPESDWYSSFYLKLYRDLQINERYKLWLHKIQVITFNYDRSLEYFLYDSLVRGHTNRIEEIQKGLNKIDFLHMYGRMARLEWQFDTKFDKDPIFIPYGKIDIAERHDRCTTNIDIMCDPSGGIIGVRKDFWRLNEYNYDLRVFEERYNIVRITGGLVGLMYAR